MLKIIMRIHIFACAYLTILFIEIFTLVFVRGQTIQDMDTLLTNLTTGYNKLIRPVTNQRDAVDVSIHYDVMGIQDIDEVKGQITVNFVLTLRWTDARLSWVPADYNMIESVVMEHGTVWKPEMKLGNPATIMTSQEYTWPHVRYSSDGSARWAPNGFYEISCSINIKYYPMDVQTCAVKFQVSSYTVREINIELPDGTAKKRDYVENGEWDLVKSVAFVDSERYAQFQIQLILARRSTLLVLITILPTVLLSALNAMVFILPPESGERISFTLTLLLALAVFFTIMSDNIPKSSSPMPILSYLIGLQLLMGGIICFVTVINLYVYYKDQQDAIPACFSLNCLRHPNRDIMSADQSSAGDAHVHNGHCQTPSTVKYSDWKSSTDMIPSTDLKLLFSRVNNESSGDKPRLEGSDTNRRLTTPDRISSSPRMTWKKISIYVDRIMFIISFIYCLVVTVVVLYILQVGDR